MPRLPVSLTPVLADSAAINERLQSGHDKIADRLGTTDADLFQRDQFLSPTRTAPFHQDGHSLYA
jgi:hypothetical protein